MELNSTALLTLVARTAIKNIGVLDDLRLIRFDDDGVVGLIDQVIEGYRPEKAEIEEKLTCFNDQEWHVQRAPKRIVREITPVSRISRDELELISWGKVEIRRQVQEAVNLWERGRFSPNIKKLQSIRSGTNDLNTAIDEFEHSMMHG